MTCKNSHLEPMMAQKKEITHKIIHQLTIWSSCLYVIDRESNPSLSIVHSISCTNLSNLDECSYVMNCYESKHYSDKQMLICKYDDISNLQKTNKKMFF